MHNLFFHFAQQKAVKMLECGWCVLTTIIIGCIQFRNDRRWFPFPLMPNENESFACSLMHAF
jgi:hypothetical protein